MDCGRIYSEAKHEIETHTSSCMAHADKSNQESSVNQVANANHGCVAVWYFFSVTFSPFFRFNTWFLSRQTQLEMPRRLVRNILFGCPKHDWKHLDTSSKVPHTVAANMAGNMSASGWKISNFYCQKQARKCPVVQWKKFSSFKLTNVEGWHESELINMLCERDVW